MAQKYWMHLVWLIWFNSFDLPQLTEFYTGRNSFVATTSITLSSKLICSFPADVPFTNGIFTYEPALVDDQSGYDNYAFSNINSSSIISDSSTPSLLSLHSLSELSILHSLSIYRFIMIYTIPYSYAIYFYYTFFLFV